MQLIQLQLLCATIALVQLIFSYNETGIPKLISFILFCAFLCLSFWFSTQEVTFTLVNSHI